MRWIADLVGTIARSGNGSDIPFGCVLLDSSDRIQWVRGDLPGPGDKPLDTLDLAWPLSSWKLACFDAGTASPALGRSLFFNFVSGISVLFLALSALSWIFYREHTRQMREASNRVNFVNQVSHELKTPLTAIRMYAELLENRIDEETDPKAREHLDVIVRESRRLSRLITNILTFGRKQRNGIVLRKNPGNPGEVVKKTVEQFRPSLEEEGIEVVLDFEDGFFESEMELDADALQQILGNLINNVEKYAAEGKWMKIRCFREGSFRVITVSDRGPGIPKSKRKKIFEPFYRISNRLTDGVSGTGIGLDIARELARLHGGDLVLVHSDRGSCFRVSIR
jgi:signal transduction histidine kinase